MIDKKDTNPKDAIGATKPPIHTIPVPVLFEIGNALLEGAVKYGGNNWRAAGVRYSIYYDAAMRHLMSWWAGEDTDPDSGVSHITKAISGLVVLRDAMLNNMAQDDRPPVAPTGWMANAKGRTEAILKLQPKQPPVQITEKNRGSAWGTPPKRTTPVIFDPFDTLREDDL